VGENGREKRERKERRGSGGEEGGEGGEGGRGYGEKLQSVRNEKANWTRGAPAGQTTGRIEKTTPQDVP